MAIKDYLFHSTSRYFVATFLVAIILIWIAWYRTDQLVSIDLIIYATNLTLLNAILGYFSYRRSRLITNLLFSFTYLMLGLVIYTFLSLIRGIAI